MIIIYNDYIIICLHYIIIMALITRTNRIAQLKQYLSAHKTEQQMTSMFSCMNDDEITWLYNYFNLGGI